MITIHNNFKSVRLSRHISTRLGSLRRTFGRISTGLRVNEAQDNTTGLKINDRITRELLETQATMKAITNESSLLQVVDGALGESRDALLRMRELAVSASSGSVLSRRDREAIEQEFLALMEEIDEIAEKTTFNGMKVLTREASSLRLSLLGDEEDTQETLSQVIKPLNTQSLGRQARYDGVRRGVFLRPLEAGDVIINGVEVRSTQNADDDLSYSLKSGSALAKVNAINAIEEFTGVRAIADANVITSRDPVREIDLDTTRWIKVNGYVVSGFKVEDADATGELKRHINRGFEETGVKAEVDLSGYLTLSAQDGRNITIEYSSDEVRDAVRVVDLFGDPVNLSDTVGAVNYQRDGDITDVTYVGTSVNFSHTLTANPDLAGDHSGQFSGTRDHVDFVIEVVDPGVLGAATYRVKREDTTHVPEGTADSTHEDYRFNVDGVITASNSSKVADFVTRYQEASTRTVRVITTEEGNLFASQVTDQPEATIILYNEDTGREEARLEQLRLRHGQVYSFFQQDYGIRFRVLEPARNQLQNAHGTVTNAELSLEQKQVGQGHDYSLTPRVSNWTGTLQTDFQISVLSSGHGIGAHDPAGTPEGPAQLQVTANIHRDGGVVTETRNVTLNSFGETYRVTFSDPGAGGITLRFPSPRSLLENDAVFTGWDTTSGYDLTPQLDRRYYVGEESREYTVRFTSDGAFTSQAGDGPSADLYSDQVFVGSIQEVNQDYFRLLGPGGVWEGLEVAMQSPTITQQSKTNVYNNSITISPHNYNGENKTVIVEITEGGDTSGADVAQYRYYDQNQPNVTIDSGDAHFNGGLTLSDGLRISGSASTTRSVSAVSTQDAPTSDYLRRTSSSGSYSRGKTGTMSAQLVESAAGVFDLEVQWNFEGGEENTNTITNVHQQLDAQLDLGFGVTAVFDSADVQQFAMTDGMTFSATATTRNLQAGDRFVATLESMVHDGDEFTVTAEPQDLASGTSWSVTGIPPLWSQGEEHTIRYQHNFEEALHTLNSTLTYPPGNQNESMGEININAQGTFQTGDEIRVHTRGFLGQVSASGFYTETLFPTDYKLTVTQSGDISEGSPGVATLSWERSDGLRDGSLEHGGEGSLNVSSADLGRPIYIEEGVYLTIEDLGEGVYLAQGDEIIIPIGQKREYTFSSGITLQSTSNINLEYSSNAVDNSMGRLLFSGTESQNNEQGGDELSLGSGLLGASQARSVRTLRLLSSSEVREAIDTIDLALDQVTEAQTAVGAVLSKAQHRIESLSNKSIDLLLIRGRIGDADLAQEIATLASEQIRLMSATLVSQVSKSSALTALDLVNNKTGRKLDDERLHISRSAITAL